MSKKSRESKSRVFPRQDVIVRQIQQAEQDLAVGGLGVQLVAIYGTVIVPDEGLY